MKRIIKYQNCEVLNMKKQLPSASFLNVTLTLRPEKGTLIRRTT